MNKDKLHSALLSLFAIAKSSEDSTKTYLNTRNALVISRFNVTDKFIKKERASAERFFAKLANDVDTADEQAAILSVLVCESDNEMNNELTSVLLNLFSLYTEWKSKISAFIASCDNVFSDNNDIKISLLITEARSLLATENAFCEELEKTINTIEQ